MNFSTWYGFYQNIWYIFSSVSTVSELQRKDYKVVCISGDTSECHGGVQSKKLGLDYKLFVGKCIHPVNWAMLISAISDPLNTDMFRQMHRRTCPKKFISYLSPFSCSRTPSVKLHILMNALSLTSYLGEHALKNFLSYLSPFSCWRTPSLKLHMLMNNASKTSYVIFHTSVLIYH